MLSWKWKLYRVSNYMLLMSSSLAFIRLFQMALTAPVKDFEIYSYSVCLVFLLMIFQSIVNLVVMAKTFPDKLLTVGKSYWHLFAIVCGVLSSLAIFYFIAFELFPQFDELQVMVYIFLFLFINLLFVLFCQLELKRFLQRNNAAAINSMLDSIGKDE